MSESSFWSYLRKVLPPEGHYSRIESATSHGFPDVFYTLDGVSGTIELKDAKRPTARCPFSGGSSLRRSQLLWIRDEIEKGGRVWLFLQCGRKIFLLDGGIYANDLLRMGLFDINRCKRIGWLKGTMAPVSKSLHTVLTEEH